jgi:hypothetical protein
MRRFVLVSAAAVVTGTMVLGSAAAYAQEAPTVSEAPAPVAVGSSTFTLPLLLSQLTVAVTTDAGGGLLDVALEPTAGFDPAQVRPNRVSFVNATDGVKVQVSTRHGGERVSVRAGSLGDISGPGGWTGDLFGTGATSTVSFVVSDAGDGGPTIEVTDVVSTADFVVGEVKRSTGDDDEHDEMSASVTIEFSLNGQTRSMRIRAEVETGDDEEGDAHSSLRISLSRVHGTELAAGDAVGPHSWTGTLCNGPASIAYHVDSEGKVTVDSTEPAGADVRADGRQATVRFSDKERVSIRVRGEAPDFTVGTSEKIDCGRNVPTVNGETVSLTTRPDDDHEGDDGDHQGDDGDHQGDDGDHQGDDGDHQGDDGDHQGDDRDRSESTSTTSTTLPTSDAANTSGG